jgi:hypothetical protein
MHPEGSRPRDPAKRDSELAAPKLDGRLIFKEEESIRREAPGRADTATKDGAAAGETAPE